MKSLYAFLLVLLAANMTCINQVQAQKEYVYQTFKDTRIINTYSIETLQKGVLDVRIGHRFGDIFKDWEFQNAWTNFFGFESAADVALGVEYGITNNFMVGIHRTKGAGPLKSLIHLIGKYKFLSQTKDNSMPISMAAAASLSVSTMWASSNTQSQANFPGGFGHRMIYSAQLHIARKFGDVFSLQVSPTFIWRNLVDYYDTNFLMTTSLAAKIQVTKVLGIILDANIPFNTMRLTSSGKPDNAAFGGSTQYRIPIGIGFEIDTGGHIFQINLTNTAGIEPTDYIPNTTLDIAKGEFRIGFTISRSFRM